ncbi:hypothetical protein HUK80_02005 [Flavobacterium sp. MAH-1]|uniref:Uncharacterized protein n=1 Tax=Flavobacterium agri TaxID=2743471 RepID=A0A7Y9C4T6_9FLAO|nr:hypothetical protein [Flavobacterium agri]NUY79654.1 hypothetical protein [Flavobacterium agri]NYA69679.1 hypothetical protein [Flavobacterium agri]
MNEVNPENNPPKPLSLKLVSAFKNFKEYLPLAIASATIIGGINQFYNLLSIDTYYVRFFSATQLISDGLWILYLLLPFYIIFTIMLPFIIAGDKYYLERFDPVSEDGKFQRKKAIWYNVLLIMTLYPTSYYFILTGRWPYMSFLLVMYTFPAMRANFKLAKKYDKEIIFELFGFISFLAFLSGLYFTWTWTFRDNEIPNNLENSSFVTDKIIKNYPNYSNKILYMNDKYVFTQIYCDSIDDPNRKILLFPIETFQKSESK